MLELFGLSILELVLIVAAAVGTSAFLIYLIKTPATAKDNDNAKAVNKILVERKTREAELVKRIESLEKEVSEWGLSIKLAPDKKEKPK